MEAQLRIDRARSSLESLFSETQKNILAVARRDGSVGANSLAAANGLSTPISSAQPGRPSTPNLDGQRSQSPSKENLLNTLASLDQYNDDLAVARSDLYLRHIQQNQNPSVEPSSSSRYSLPLKNGLMSRRRMDHKNNAGSKNRYSDINNADDGGDLYSLNDEDMSPAVFGLSTQIQGLQDRLHNVQRYVTKSLSSMSAKVNEERNATLSQVEGSIAEVERRITEQVSELSKDSRHNDLEFRKRIKTEISRLERALEEKALQEQSHLSELERKIRLQESQQKQVLARVTGMGDNDLNWMQTQLKRDSKSIEDLRQEQSRNNLEVRNMVANLTSRLEESSHDDRLQLQTQAAELKSLIDSLSIETRNTAKQLANADRKAAPSRSSTSPLSKEIEDGLIDKVMGLVSRQMESRLRMLNPVLQELKGGLEGQESTTNVIRRRLDNVELATIGLNDKHQSQRDIVTQSELETLERKLIEYNQPCLKTVAKLVNRIDDLEASLAVSRGTSTGALDLKKQKDTIDSVIEKRLETLLEQRLLEAEAKWTSQLHAWEQKYQKLNLEKQSNDLQLAETEARMMKMMEEYNQHARDRRQHQKLQEEERQRREKEQRERDLENTEKRWQQYREEENARDMKLKQIESERNDDSHRIHRQLDRLEADLRSQTDKWREAELTMTRERQEVRDLRNRQRSQDEERWSDLESRLLSEYSGQRSTASGDTSTLLTKVMKMEADLQSTQQSIALVRTGMQEVKKIQDLAVPTRMTRLQQDMKSLQDTVTDQLSESSSKSFDNSQSIISLETNIQKLHNTTDALERHIKELLANNMDVETIGNRQTETESQISGLKQQIKEETRQRESHERMNQKLVNDLIENARADLQEDIKQLQNEQNEGVELVASIENKLKQLSQPNGPFALVDGQIKELREQSQFVCDQFDHGMREVKDNQGKDALAIQSLGKELVEFKERLLQIHDMVESYSAHATSLPKHANDTDNVTLATLPVDSSEWKDLQSQLDNLKNGLLKQDQFSVRIEQQLADSLQQLEQAVEKLQQKQSNIISKEALWTTHAEVERAINDQVLAIKQNFLSTQTFDQRLQQLVEARDASRGDFITRRQLANEINMIEDRTTGSQNVHKEAFEFQIDKIWREIKNQQQSSQVVTGETLDATIRELRGEQTAFTYEIQGELRRLEKEIANGSAEQEKIKEQLKQAHQHDGQSSPSDQKEEENQTHKTFRDKTDQLDGITEQIVANSKKLEALTRTCNDFETTLDNLVNENIDISSVNEELKEQMESLNHSIQVTSPSENSDERKASGGDSLQSERTDELEQKLHKVSVQVEALATGKKELETRLNELWENNNSISSVDLQEMESRMKELIGDKQMDVDLVTQDDAKQMIDMVAKTISEDLSRQAAIDGWVKRSQLLEEIDGRLSTLQLKENKNTRDPTDISKEDPVKDKHALDQETEERLQHLMDMAQHNASSISSLTYDRQQSQKQVKDEHSELLAKISSIVENVGQLNSDLSSDISSTDTRVDRVSSDFKAFVDEFNQWRDGHDQARSKLSDMQLANVELEKTLDARIDVMSSRVEALNELIGQTDERVSALNDSVTEDNTDVSQRVAKLIDNIEELHQHKLQHDEDYAGFVTGLEQCNDQIQQLIQQLDHVKEQVSKKDPVDKSPLSPSASLDLSHDDTEIDVDASHQEVTNSTTETKKPSRAKSGRDDDKAELRASIEELRLESGAAVGALSHRLDQAIEQLKRGLERLFHNQQKLAAQQAQQINAVAAVAANSSINNVPPPPSTPPPTTGDQYGPKSVGTSDYGSALPAPDLHPQHNDDTADNKTDAPKRARGFSIIVTPPVNDGDSGTDDSDFGDIEAVEDDEHAQKQDRDSKDDGSTELVSVKEPPSTSSPTKSVNETFSGYATDELLSNSDVDDSLRNGDETETIELFHLDYPLNTTGVVTFSHEFQVNQDGESFDNFSLDVSRTATDDGFVVSAVHVDPLSALGANNDDITGDRQSALQMMHSRNFSTCSLPPSMTLALHDNELKLYGFPNFGSILTNDDTIQAGIALFKEHLLPALCVVEVYGGDPELVLCANAIKADDDGTRFSHDNRQDDQKHTSGFDRTSESNSEPEQSRAEGTDSKENYESNQLGAADDFSSSKNVTSPSQPETKLGSNSENIDVHDVEEPIDIDIDDALDFGFTASSSVSSLPLTETSSSSTAAPIAPGGPVNIPEACSGNLSYCIDPVSALDVDNDGNGDAASVKDESDEVLPIIQPIKKATAQIGYFDDDDSSESSSSEDENHVNNFVGTSSLDPTSPTPDTDQEQGKENNQLNEDGVTTVEDTEVVETNVQEVKDNEPKMSYRTQQTLARRAQTRNAAALGVRNLLNHHDDDPSDENNLVFQAFGARVDDDDMGDGDEKADDINCEFLPDEVTPTFIGLKKPSSDRKNVNQTDDEQKMNQYECPYPGDTKKLELYVCCINLPRIGWDTRPWPAAIQVSGDNFSGCWTKSSITAVPLSKEPSQVICSFPHPLTLTHIGGTNQNIIFSVHNSNDDPPSKVCSTQINLDQLSGALSSSNSIELTLGLAIKSSLKSKKGSIIRVSLNPLSEEKRDYQEQTSVNLTKVEQEDDENEIIDDVSLGAGILNDDDGLSLDFPDGDQIDIDLDNLVPDNIGESSEEPGLVAKKSDVALNVSASDESSSDDDDYSEFAAWNNTPATEASTTAQVSRSKASQSSSSTPANAPASSQSRPISVVESNAAPAGVQTSIGKIGYFDDDDEESSSDESSSEDDDDSGYMQAPPTTSPELATTELVSNNQTPAQTSSPIESTEVSDTNDQTANRDDNKKIEESEIDADNQDDLGTVDELTELSVDLSIGKDLSAGLPNDLNSVGEDDGGLTFSSLGLSFDDYDDEDFDLSGI